MKHMVKINWNTSPQFETVKEIKVWGDQVIKLPGPSEYTFTTVDDEVWHIPQAAVNYIIEWTDD